MVEPSCGSRSARLRVAAVVALGVGCSSLAGCSFVPRTRLDECHRLSQTLQAENDRLKDTTISLRSQNQDLNQRAMDDGRRLRLQEEEVQRLVQSVSAYQEERDQLAAAFARIQSQVRTTATAPAGPHSAGLPGRLEDLARAHPGWEFDAGRGILTIPSARLFEPGSDRLRPEARASLAETAALWGTPEAGAFDLLVVGRNAPSAVQQARLSAPGTQAKTLGHDRAARVRDVLGGAAHIDAARIEVAGFEAANPAEVGGDDEASLARQRRIEIHLRRRDSTPSPSAASPPADRSDP
jgi:chemotaxis protein MotB